jgi:hypothetical protein
MTRDTEFIEQLEKYLDDYDGVTTLPEHVREALRAQLPKTKQAGALRGPARYLPMFSTRIAQVALGLAAAILIVAVGAFLYSGRNVGGPDEAPSSPTTEAVSSSSAAAENVCEATTARATGLGGDTLAVVWCAYGPGEPREVSFTMEAPSSWAAQFFPGRKTLWLRPAEGGAIALALHEDESVDDMVDDITGREGYVVANESTVTLDDAAGVSLDVSLADGSASSDALPLIADDDQTWPLQEGLLTRVWIVDVDGDTLMIAAGQDLADEVGDALSTIQWGR